MLILAESHIVTKWENLAGVDMLMKAVGKDCTSLFSILSVIQ